MPRQYLPGSTSTFCSLEPRFIEFGEPWCSLVYSHRCTGDVFFSSRLIILQEIDTVKSIKALLNMYWTSFLSIWAPPSVLPRVAQLALTSFARCGRCLGCSTPSCSGHILHVYLGWSCGRLLAQRMAEPLASGTFAGNVGIAGPHSSLQVLLGGH